MPRPFSILICLSLSALFWGCIDLIELEGTRQPGQLVISGRVSNSKGPHIVHISRSAESDRVSLPLGRVRVKVVDEFGQEGIFNEQWEGRYVLEPNRMQFITGRSYFLDVELPDGSRYRSQPERLPSIEGSLSIRNEFSADTRFALVYGDTETSPTDSAFFLKWDIEELFEFVPTDFPDPFGSIPPNCYVFTYPQQRVLVFDGGINPTQEIKDQLIIKRRLDWTFFSRHMFSVYLSALNENAYDYWKKVDLLIQRNGSIFDPPPAAVPGNLYNVNDPEEVVLGFFEASSMLDTARVMVLRGELPFDPLPYCEYDRTTPIDRYPDGCVNCLELKNSSLNRPGYFR